MIQSPDRHSQPREVDDEVQECGVEGGGGGGGGREVLFVNRCR